MKIKLDKLADAAIKVAVPIVAAAIVHKAATGKLDIKGAALDALADAVDRRRQ